MGGGYSNGRSSYAGYSGGGYSNSQNFASGYPSAHRSAGGLNYSAASSASRNFAPTSAPLGYPSNPRTGGGLNYSKPAYAGAAGGSAYAPALNHAAGARAPQYSGGSYGGSYTGSYTGGTPAATGFSNVSFNQGSYV